jgi:hypothetical protein
MCRVIHESTDGMYFFLLAIYYPITMPVLKGQLSSKTIDTNSEGNKTT